MKAEINITIQINTATATNEEVDLLMQLIKEARNNIVFIEGHAKVKELNERHGFLSPEARLAAKKEQEPEQFGF